MKIKQTLYSLVKPLDMSARKNGADSYLPGSNLDKPESSCLKSELPLSPITSKKILASVPDPNWFPVYVFTV